ncbi:replication-relaxation family protein [Actinacidiphila glaucinigra]|uniref:replication-relaxation family protein n=1 Tax=Actinacidiphila glaucinigra TaxID=235986 RepID=UPI002DD87136|nr:replication-relaxation family protein [Actinacidiphila glaucinigra]WSD57529.1 replication-relaxation family protein [Actinacidiphila glaucinigra]WSD65116.1 replication-relaxation family protein [Actinacidiphila glaucinigra]
MTGSRRWPYGSTARVRGLVLLALGVVKVATAGQLRQLVLPGTADVQTVRNACKDLKAAGLVESVGSANRPGRSGRPVAEQVWNLTTAGLAAAASELGRLPKEMGGTAREAAKAGAAHALKVTDTIDAFCQSPPQPTHPIPRRSPRRADEARPVSPGPAPTETPAQSAGPAAGTQPAPAVQPGPRPVSARPRGLGTLRGWTTEVILPVTGTFTTPGRGSLRADAVLTAPQDQLPVLFVEVDNHTEPAAVLAGKIARYHRFFQRSLNGHRVGDDVPLWSTRWDDSGRGGYPPVAIVFTRRVSPQVLQHRISEVARLSAPYWQGTWYTGPYTDASGTPDGWRTYDFTVPVLTTTLDQLAAGGPHGPVWRRFGHDIREALIAALANPDDHRAYRQRDEQRRAARQAAEQARAAAKEARRQRRKEEQRRRRAEMWPCPSCGTDVHPDDYDDGQGDALAPGAECPSCRSQRERLDRERAEAEAQWERERRGNGLFGWLRG